MCSVVRFLKFFTIFVAKLSLMAEEMDIQHTEVKEPKRMVLRAEGLVKKYGKRTVVNGVNFEVRQGEIVGLLGPNARLCEGIRDKTSCNRRKPQDRRDA